MRNIILYALSVILVVCVLASMGNRNWPIAYKSQTNKQRQKFTSPFPARP